MNRNISLLYFDFLTTDPYSTIPISVFRKIETEFKEKISFTTTEIGKQLNYIMLSWLQEPTRPHGNIDMDKLLNPDLTPIK